MTRDLPPVRGTLYGRRRGRPRRWPVVVATVVAVALTAAGVRFFTAGLREVAAALLILAGGAAVCAITLVGAFWRQVQINRIAQQGMAEIEAYANHRSDSGGDR